LQFRNLEVILCFLGYKYVEFFFQSFELLLFLTYEIFQKKTIINKNGRNDA